jgi:hypothetical protein
MGRQSISYGPFGLRWGFLGIAVLSGASLVGLLVLQRDMRMGSSLRCARPGADGRSNRCTLRKGSRSHSFNLEGVRGARIGRKHRTHDYEVYLTYADGATQKVLPNGRAVQHRFGPTDITSAQQAVRRFERYLRDPTQHRLELDLPATHSALIFVGVMALLAVLIVFYSLFHILRAFTYFIIEPGLGPQTLKVRRSVLGFSRETRTIHFQDITRVEVERLGLDRLLHALSIRVAQGGRIALYAEPDVPVQYLTRASYPGARQHEETAEALRALMSPRN